MKSAPTAFSVTALAEAIANNASEEELSLIAALLIQLGYTLEAIAALRRINN